MDATNFDRMTRRVSAAVSRRQTLGALAVATIGLASAGLPGARSARKKRKKANGPKPNQYGCLDIGKACRGNGELCCSGICQGQKPKKGKKDTSACVAHHVSDCEAGQDYCVAANTACGAAGNCFQTTGKASFCGLAGAPCRVCGKDADCELVYGPGAACVVCENACPDTRTRCIVADA
jgi:hypothetical protein